MCIFSPTEYASTTIYHFDRICKHYVPVREPRRRVYRRVVEAEYETVCAPDGTVCTKTRPEYREEQTISRSFLSI